MKQLLIQPTPKQSDILNRHITTLQQSLEVAAQAAKKYQQYVKTGELPEVSEIDFKLWKDLLNHYAWQNDLIDQLCPYMRKQFAWNIYFLQDKDFSPPDISVGRDALMLQLENYEPTQYYWNKTPRKLYLPVIGFVDAIAFGEFPKKLTTLILQQTSEKTLIWCPNE